MLDSLFAGARADADARRDALPFAQVEAAGTQTSGRGPWVDSSQPAEMAAAASA